MKKIYFSRSDFAGGYGSSPERDVIKKVYNINQNTYMPSVFGANNLTFNEKTDILIENENDYLNTIKREIEARMVGKLPGTKRAILVFFESKKELMKFFNSDVFFNLKDSTNILTEEASRQEKEVLVKRATTNGRITLLTKVFGRGTDFICQDQEVGSNGGVHVIQTFLSEEGSEEVQIKGRTARQGDHGSYSMILLGSSLEKFGITKEAIEDIQKGRNGGLIPLNTSIPFSKSTYDVLNEKRNQFFKTQYQSNDEFVKLAKKHHDQGQKFLESIFTLNKNGSLEIVKEFLKEKNKGASLVQSQRTIVLMDATRSMSHALNNAKNTVKTMFERTFEILKENGINEKSFQIQFAVYRNYSNKEYKIWQNSTWETKPDNLRKFIDQVSPRGGWGNEAIEIGLWHANREKSVSQVILIGDQPANTDQEVVNKREMFGENYWKTTRFNNPTTLTQELEK